MMASHDIAMQLDIKVQMRDGVRLSADIYRPRGAPPVPAVLIRTPYSNNNQRLIEQGRRLAASGYACVIQDCRGRWDSDGEFYPLREAEDGYDTQEWVGLQPWCNGKLGTVGASYLGIVQWTAAPLRSSHLACMAPRVMGPDFHGSIAYPGGAFQLGVLLTWGMRTNARTAQSIDYHNWTEAFHTLPVAALDEVAGRHVQFWRDWVSHPDRDDYWRGFADPEPYAEIAAPAYLMGGWYDVFANDTLRGFAGMRRHGRTDAARRSRLIVGPWAHALSESTRVGDVDFGPQSLWDLDAEEQRWLDYWLKGESNGIADEPPMKLFIMGAGEWRDEWEWPLTRTEWRTAYLDSGGDANTLRGDGRLAFAAPREEAADHFVYDPRYPVQTVGGNNCCSPEIVPWGPYDQRGVEMRPDVLCYTSEPMAEDLEVTGPVELFLYAATDGPDTDWTAKLVDVSPTGYARNLCDGIVRARYRQGMTATALAEPGATYEYRIEVGVTGNLFRAGHRIRLEVASSNFPRFDRNPNTGNEFGVDRELRTARQTVYHGPRHPSHLRLPVIPPRPSS